MHSKVSLFFKFKFAFLSKNNLLSNLDNGCVISPTIVETEAMKKRIIAKESIANVPNLNSVAEMVNVFQVAGCAVSKHSFDVLCHCLDFRICFYRS